MHLCRPLRNTCSYNNSKHALWSFVVSNPTGCCCFLWFQSRGGGYARLWQPELMSAGISGFNITKWKQVPTTAIMQNYVQNYVPCRDTLTCESARTCGWTHHHALHLGCPYGDITVVVLTWQLIISSNILLPVWAPSTSTPANNCELRRLLCGSLWKSLAFGGLISAVRHA